jgi:hypothetical protein
MDLHVLLMHMDLQVGVCYFNRERVVESLMSVSSYM